MAAVAILTVSTAAMAADVGHVAVLHHDGSPYDWRVGGQPNVAPRIAIAQQFFQTHSDAYDFLIVFPTFPAQMENGPLGSHTRVRNDVAGIGMPLSENLSFGSQRRLKGYIDVNTLAPGTSESSLDATWTVLAHEVEHQWAARVQYLDPLSAQLSAGLLSADLSHWNPLLNSNGSVLGGSLWVPNPDGSWTATESHKRYSDLDLYLMGFLSPEAVAPFTLLSPAVVVTPPADGESPFPDGTVLPATAQTVSIGDVLAAEGPRVPAANASQRVFRAAFALLLPPGVEATTDQIAYVDAARREWANRFFILTRGLAVMDTELAEAPIQLNNNPTVSAGLSYLLSRQRSDGTWADQDATVVRDTHAAVTALALFATDASAAAARDRGAAALQAMSPSTVDEMARRILSLGAAGQPIPADALTALAAARDPRLNLDGGFGIQRGYATDALDTALAGLAAVVGGKGPAELSTLTRALVSMQAIDGGYSYSPGGPSRVEPTARVVEYLARLPLEAQNPQSSGRALVFLANRTTNLYEDGPTELENALATSALAAWNQDRGIDPQSLLVSQRTDGSWRESVRVTGEVLRALRTLLVPNFVLSPSEVMLSTSTAVQGEFVAATVTVHNDGHGPAAAGALLRATDSSGVPFTAPFALPGISSGSSATVTLTLDTSGHQGSSAVFLTVDPDRLVDETRKDDNQAAVPLRISDIPQAPDLYVAPTSLSSVPAAVETLPAALTISATVGNLGAVAATGVAIVLYRGGDVLGTTTVDLPAQSVVPVSFPIQVATSDRLVLRVAVDPQGAVADANPSNNSASLEVPIVQRAALTLSALTPSVSEVAQGAPFSIGWTLASTGTAALSSIAVTLDAFDASGNHLAVPYATTTSLLGGETRSFLATWHADVIGPVVLKARAEAIDSAGNPIRVSSDCVITVDPSSQPNLLFSSSISVSPDPVIAGQVATASASFVNAGADAGPFVVEAWLGDPANGGTQVGSIAFAGLAAGATASAQATFTLADASETSLVFLLDANDQVSEFDEDDNTIVRVLHPRTIADLTVADADIQLSDAFPRPGDTVQVQVTIHNAGGLDAFSVPVELWLGSDVGGTLISSTTVDVAASGATTASFSWPTVGLSGSQQLIAVVNGSHAVAETRYDNDRAVKTVLLQDGPLALRNPFFSPNGDGVRDTTEVFFRFAQPATGAVVQITDTSGIIVRTIQQQFLAPSASGSAVWDGADDAGSTVRDGSYAITVYAADAGAAPLGPSTVVVDTNRSSLVEAAGTAYLAKVSLEPYFARHDYSMSPPAMTSDDRALVYGVGQIVSTSCTGICDPGGFFGCWCTSRISCSIEQLPVDLGTGTRITPDGWGTDCPYHAEGIAVSPDAQTIAMSASNVLQTYSVATKTTQTIYDGNYTTVNGHAEDDSLAFSNDGQWLRFRRYDYNSWWGWNFVGASILHADGSQLQDIDSWNVGVERFSPDSTRIASGSQSIRQLSDGATSWLPGGGYSALDWSSDSRKLFFTASNWWNGSGEYTEGAMFGFADLPGGTPHLLVDLTAKFGSGFEPRGLTISPADGTPVMQGGFHNQDTGVTNFALYAIPPGQSDFTLLYQRPDHASLASFRFSPRGTYLLLHDTNGWSILESYRNLGIRLSAAQDRAVGAIVFTGTAADANFSDYDIAIRRMGSTVPPAVVVRGTREVIDDLLGSWVPPSPGVYEATLTARDKAGNVRNTRVFAASTLEPVLTAFSAEPRYISPNGDGKQDQATIKFSVKEPVSTRFDVVNSAGQVVRSFARTLVAAGEDSFVWDGTDAAGSVVPDGEYLIRCSDGGAVPVAVDLTPPKAYFAYSNQADVTPFPDIVATAQADLDEYPATRPVNEMLEVTNRLWSQTSDGKLVQVPQLGLRDVWQGYDRVDGSSIETLASVGPEQADSPQGPFAAVADPAVPGEIANKTELFKLSRAKIICGGGEPPPLPLSAVRGKWFRGRAVDFAGNVTETTPGEIPRALYALGIGDASALDPSNGTITVAGEVLPRVDLLSPLYPSGLGALCHASPPPGPNGPFFQPGKLGMFLQFTGPERIVSYAIRYPTASGAIATDWQNVTWLASGALTWDASYIAWDVSHIEVIGTDELGREWPAEIDFAVAPHETGVSACTTGAGKAWFSYGAPAAPVQQVRVELYALGAKLAEQVNVFDAADLDPSAPGMVAVDVSHLGSCEYNANVTVATVDGKLSRGGTRVNVCTLDLASTSMADQELRANLVSSFRDTMTGIDAYLVQDGSDIRIPIGSAAGVSGTGTAAFDVSRIAACTQGTLGFVAHFWGTPDYDSANDGFRCKSLPTRVNIPCDRTSVSVAVTTPPAPSCSTHEVTWAVNVDADTARPGGTIVQLHAALRSAQNLQTAPLALDAFEPASSVRTAGHVSTAGMVEGIYFVGVAAVDSGGDRFVVGFDPDLPNAPLGRNPPRLIVDRTAPVATLASPADGTRVCATPALSSAGVSSSVFRAAGTIADAHLADFRIEMAPIGAGFDSYFSSDWVRGRTSATVSGDVDFAGLASRDYGVRLVATDTSGNSGCSAPVTVHLDPAVRVSAFSPEARVFSPDADGVDDTATLHFQLDESASVHLDVVRGDGTFASAVATDATFGDSVLGWDGTLADGSKVPDGDWELRLTATDGCSNTSTASTYLAIDTTPPTVQVDSPVAGMAAAGQLVVRGTVADANLTGYEVLVGAGSSPAAFTQISSSDHAETGVLGAVDLTALAAGPYVVRIAAHDSVGHSSTVDVPFSVGTPSLIAQLSATPVLYSKTGTAGLAASVTLADAASVRLTIEDAAGTPLVVITDGLALSAGTSQVPVPAAQVAGLGDAQYRMRLDAASSTTTDSAETWVVFDATAPVIDGIVPADGAVTRANVDVLARFTETHLASWSLELDSGAGFTQIAGGASVPGGVIAQLRGLSEGVHRLRIRARDGAGNAAESISSFVVDATPPTLQFASPLDGDLVTSKSDPNDVVLTLADAHPARIRLEAVHAAAGTAETLLDTATAGGTISIPWTVAAEADGPVTLRATAEDLAGNKSVASINLRVDNTPPNVSLSMPGPGYLRVVQVIGNVADTNLVSWTLEMARGPAATALAFTPLAGGSAPGPVFFGFPQYPEDGTYTIRLSAKDAAGNERSTSVEVIADRTPPAPPASVVATVQNGRDVLLSWTASADSDVAGYTIQRATGSGDFQPLTTTPSPALTYLDAGLSDQSYRYRVIAVDLAGNIAAPSMAAPADVHANPPLASISFPRPNVAVSGVVQVTGSAMTSYAFKEYRLSLGAGLSPSSWTLLARSTQPAAGGVLGSFDTALLAQGSQQSLLLEVEDGYGNVARQSVSFSVDDVAPSAPVLVSAAAQGNAITVQWQPSPDSDVAGYLVYRNGALANAPDAFTDLTPYLVPPTTTLWVDASRPDGTYTYQVQAMDVAGNLSPLSNAIDVRLDLAAPAAHLIAPSHLDRVTGPFTVAADFPDQDVASVQFQARSSTASGFTTFATAKAAPWSAQLDPATLPDAAFEVRAVATDTGGKVDPSPASITLFYAPLPAPPVVQTLTDGDTVTISWSLPSGDAPAQAVIASSPRYLLGTQTSHPSGTTTASSGNSAAGYDGNSSTYWQGSGSGSQYWQIVFSTPVLVNSLSVNLNSTAAVSVRVNGGWVRAGIAQTASNGPVSVPLGDPLLVEAVRLDSTYPYLALYELSLDVPYLTTTPTAVETGAPQGSRTYTVKAITALGQTASGTATALIYVPQLDEVPAVVADSDLTLTGCTAPGADAHVVLGGAEVAVAPVGSDCRFTAHVPLATGTNALSVQGIDAAGNRSLRAYASVLLDPAPAVALTLSGAANGSTVDLSWTEQGDATNVDHLELWRTVGDAPESLLTTLDRAATQYSDGSLQNGTYRYEIFAVNGHGFRSAPSNEIAVPVQVAPPPAPSGLTVSAPEQGGALSLAWSESVAVAGFVVERADTFGTFQRIADVTAAAFVDTGLTNGVTYWYQVRARDALGNLSAPSAVASGTPADQRLPPAPVIEQPTTSGSPISLGAPNTNVGGSAQAGTTVDLYRNGEMVGSAPTVSGTLRTPVHLSYPLGYASGGKAFDLASDGKSWTYLARLPSGQTAVALEKSDGTVNAVSLTGVYVLSVALAPDASKAAAVVMVPPTYARNVYVVDFATSTAAPLVKASVLSSTSERYAPAWAADSQALAYVGGQMYHPSAVGIASLADGAEQVVVDVGQDYVLDLAWPATDAVLVTVLRPGAVILRKYAPSGSSLDLFSSTYPPQIVATTSDRAAVLDRSVFPEAIRMVPLDGSAVTAVASAYGSTAPGAFTSGADGLDWIDMNQAWHLELSSGAVTSLGQVAPNGYESYPRSLFAPTDGRIIVDDAYLGIFSLRTGDFWTVPSVALLPGDNVFTASASLPSGVSSPLSEPVLVSVGLQSLPDLAVEPRIVPAVPVAGDPVSAVIRVRNLGEAASDPTTVVASVLGSDGSLRTNTGNVPAIQPGGYADTIVPVDISGLRGLQTLIAAVQSGDRDANHDNDQKRMQFLVVSGPGLNASVSLSSPQVGADGTVQASAIFVNTGDPTDATLQLRLVDSAGEQVFIIDSIPVPQFQGPDPLAVTRAVAVGRTLAGDYKVVAEAVVSGSVAASSEAALRIVPEVNVAVSTTPGRAVFPAGVLPSFTYEVQNHSRNSLLSGAVAIADVADQQGTIVFTSTTSLPSILVDGSWSGAVEIPSPGLPSGPYVATVHVLKAGLELGTGSAAFQVAGEPLLEGAIEIVGGRGTPPAIPSGHTAALHFILENSGTADANGVQMHVGVRDPQSLAIIASQDFSFDVLAAGDWRAEEVALPTAGLSLKSYAVSMTASQGTGAPELIATRTFRVADSLAPALTVPLAQGAFVRGRVGLGAHASDESSGVAGVMVAIDTMAPVPLTLVSGNAADGDWRVAVSLTDGPHALTFSAFDAEGNIAVLPAIQVTSDSTAPVVTLSGVADGALVATAVTPEVAVADANLAAVTVTLNGDAFVPGTRIEADGDYQLTVSAVDRAGNETAQSVAFSIDRTAPAVSVLGVVEGQYAASNILPIIEVHDRHPATTTVLLDGLAFAEGTPVSTEGMHLLEVDAIDAAGNTSSEIVQFVIDRTPPVVSWSGFIDGTVVADPVTASFSAADANLSGAWATANGRGFASGATLTDEGTYLMVATAADLAGNQRSVSATVTIDRTPPRIALSGFVSGSVGRLPVTPAFDVQDAALDHVDATLNGAPFASGTTVSAQGTYTLLVTAVDRAGNHASASGTFTIDTVPPAITMAGFAEGMVVSTDVTPTYSSSSPDLASLSAVLNDAPFTSGTLVHDEAAYTLVATATDNAGNQTSAIGHFTIDRTPPDVTILGVKDGDVVSASLQPDFRANDANLSYAVALLNGAPFVGGTVLVAEGPYTLTIRAVDKAGNRTEKSASFAIDRTPPSIWTGGVADGAVVPNPVTLTFGANDANPGVVSGTLNGAPVESGSVISAEGDYALRVIATDRAGNTSERDLSFAIDRTPPHIQVAGVVDGTFLSVTSVIPTFTIDDAHPGTSSATLDGTPFVSGTEVAAEATHKLVVSATDRALNAASLSVTFTLDRTAPQISITGVSDGATYDDAVTPVIAISDANLADSAITLNGTPFTSGTKIGDDGTYTLSVRATDKAGNSASTSIGFTVLQVKYAVRKTLAAPQPILALLRAGNCTLGAADQARLTSFISAAFPQHIVTTVTDDATFLARLRSGLYGLVAWVNTGNAPDASCRQDADAGCTSATCNLRRSVDRELTEAVFSGRVGLVMLRDRTEVLPGLREALGADSAGAISADALVFGSDPVFGSLASVSVPLTAVRLSPISASTVGTYSGVTTPSAPIPSVGATHHPFGAGHAVLFGFDLSASTTGAEATAALVRSAEVVTPLASALSPLGVAGVQLDVTNLAKGVTTRIRETLPAGLQPLSSLPATDLTATPIEWQLALDNGQTASISWFARLPEQPGKYTVSTEVAALRPSGTRIFGVFPLDLQLGESPDGLFANATAAATALPASGHDGAVRTRILQVLSNVSTRPVASTADIELDISDLLSAVDDTRTLQTVDPAPMRLALDELIRYWEARWSLQ